MNNERLQELYQQKGYKKLDIKVGQHLELHEKLGDRTWRFKGLVIKVQKPSHPDGTFTIRGVAAGHTIEKVYPLSFTRFTKVTVLDEYKVRKSKLYYIREKVGKDAKFKSIITTDRKDFDLLGQANERAEAHKAKHTKKVEVAVADVAVEAAPEVESTTETTE